MIFFRETSRKPQALCAPGTGAIGTMTGDTACNYGVGNANCFTGSTTGAAAECNYGYAPATSVGCVAGPADTNDAYIGNECTSGAAVQPISNGACFTGGGA